MPLICFLAPIYQETSIQVHCAVCTVHFQHRSLALVFLHTFFCFKALSPRWYSFTTCLAHFTFLCKIFTSISKWKGFWLSGVHFEMTAKLYICMDDVKCSSYLHLVIFCLVIARQFSPSLKNPRVSQCIYLKPNVKCHHEIFVLENNLLISDL